MYAWRWYWRSPVKGNAEKKSVIIGVRNVERIILQAKIKLPDDLGEFLLLPVSYVQHAGRYLVFDPGVQVSHRHPLP